MSKSTVTVTCSWFSSNPVFKDVLAAIKREMSEKKVLYPEAIKVLEDLLPLNGNEPITGYTDYGPHTFIRFEAPTLGKGVGVAQMLENFLRHEFPGNDQWGNFQGMSFRFAGKILPDLLEFLETALGDAQQDLKGTRRFLPSKRIQRLRLVHEELHQ